MKDEALSLARAVHDPVQRLNILREYLQALTLRSLHESEAFRCLAFVGGTALRFLHGLPRFSEDMDFSLHSPAGYASGKWMEKVKRDLLLAGLDASVNWNERKTVNVGWIRIGELLKELGLGTMPRQKLSIKLEIDTRPPAGARTEDVVVERHRMFVVRCNDLPSLMAGKLHALIARRYPKGRDWYDFLWYCAKRPAVEPNLSLLQNALDQTQGKGVLDGRRWRALVEDRIRALDFGKLRDDVMPFLERAGEADMLAKDHLLSVLKNG